jgi:hypothetical protein
MVRLVKGMSQKEKPGRIGVGYEPLYLYRLRSKLARSQRGLGPGGGAGRSAGCDPAVGPTRGRDGRVSAPVPGA